MPHLPATATTHPLLKITSSAQLELRGRILAAAKQRFARFSREDTTLADIARLARLEIDDVEDHFEDVDELMSAVQRTMDRGRTPRRPGNRPVRHGFVARERKSVPETRPA